MSVFFTSLSYPCIMTTYLSQKKLKKFTKYFVVYKKTTNFALQKIKKMRKDIHPKDYRFVVFKDMSNEVTFITKSTAQTKDTITWEDGKEYPLIKLEISNTSHPFYTGKIKLVDTAGRIDKFNNRYKKTTNTNS